MVEPLNSKLWKIKDKYNNNAFEIQKQILNSPFRDLFLANLISHTHGCL